MKKYLLTVWILSVVLLITSCSTNSGTTANTSQYVSAGTWRVTLFTSNGTDETSDFAGYSFTFSSTGVLGTLKSGVTQNGTWSFTSSSNKFSIDLGPNTVSNKPLGELTNDWKILSSTATELRLQDDNPARNEYVTFTKN